MRESEDWQPLVELIDAGMKNLDLQITKMTEHPSQRVGQISVINPA